MITEPIPEPTPQAPVHERRLAPIPLMIAGISLFAIIVFTAVVVALAARNEPAPTPTPIASSASASPTPTLEPSETARPQARANECVDELGDGEPIDLDSVRMDDDGDGGYVATFQLVQALPDTGDVTLGLYLAADNGHRAKQLTGYWSDGELTDLILYDLDDDDEEEELDLDQVGDQGSTVSLRFDRDAIKRIDHRWSWFAFGGVDDNIVDTCPGAVGSFDTMRFGDR